MNYYRKHDESAADLKEKVTLLNLNKKTKDVEAILRGYLWNHSKNAEPWMYEALALAIEMNKGKPSDAKTSLKYAADVAEKTQNPNHLLSVADQLFLHGEYAQAAPLIDEVAGKLPHRAEPLMMSINLAAKTKDPERMATSVDKLLSLGWPGYDEKIRRDAHRVVETLAKALREEDRDAEAEALTNRLAESESRDLYVRLSWLGDAGLGLTVDEPLGATAKFAAPRTVFGGSIIKDGYGKHPEAIYVCPRAFDGDYTIRVDPFYNNPEKPALEATLEVITHEGTSRERKQTHTIALNAKTPAPVVVHLEGGRRKAVLPFVAPPQPPVASQDAPKPKETEAAAKKDARPATNTPKAAQTAPSGTDGVRARPR
jgi:hypothetical protein